MKGDRTFCYKKNKIHCKWRQHDLKEGRKRKERKSPFSAQFFTSNFAPFRLMRFFHLFNSWHHRAKIYCMMNFLTWTQTPSAMPTQFHGFLIFLYLNETFFIDFLKIISTKHSFTPQRAQISHKFYIFMQTSLTPKSSQQGETHNYKFSSENFPFSAFSVLRARASSCDK